MDSEEKTNCDDSLRMDENSSKSSNNSPDASCNHEIASTTAPSTRIAAGLETSDATTGCTSTEIRRSTVKDLIERYFYQLQRGCGNSSCTNVNCASSGLVQPMSPNETAAKAIQLFSQDARLCDGHNVVPKVSRVQADTRTSSQPISSSNMSSNRHNSDRLASQMIANSVNNSAPSSNPSSASTSASSSRSTSTTSSLASTGTHNSRNSTAGRAITGPTLAELWDNITGQMSTDSSPERQPRQSNNIATESTEAPLPSGPSTANTNDDDIFNRCPTVHYLNEQIIDDLIEKGRQDGKYERLLNAITDVYYSVDRLSQSFRRPKNVVTQLTCNTTATKLQELLGKSPSDLKKEDLRSLEGENEKDEDSTCASRTSMEVDEAADSPALNVVNNSSSSITGDATHTLNRNLAVSDDSDDDDMATIVASTSSKANRDFAHLKNTGDMLVDLESLRRVKKKLFALNELSIAETLNTNIVLLSETIKYQYKQWNWEQVLHCIIICFDMITNISNSLMDFEFLERSLPKLCQAVRVLPIPAQARLTRIWSVHCKNQLHSLVQCCQQLISLNVIVNDSELQENLDIIAATKVLKIAYYASILAGESDPTRNPILNEMGQSEASTSSGQQHDDDELFVFGSTETPKTLYPRYADDDLAKELNLRAMYCRMPIVPYDEFYNEPLSDAIQMDRDYLGYKKLLLDPNGEEIHFSFMLYSFILTPATKVVGLYYDNRIRMYSERHTSFYSMLSLYNGEVNDLNSTPDLKLKVHRDNIVNDALVGLELVAMSNPKDLKKQLVIEFVGEQGIDEGGVSKEFFQLIVDEIFNVDFGMFIELDETDAFWFNSMSFENDAQFTLIGIIIGLAIYNNIILAVRFPMVVYRKLMGAYGAFYDLKDFSPTLYRSLKSMLEYDDDDMEDVFMQTFKISYKNVFGEVVEHELKPGGADIVVGQSNKQDFVDMYADFLLNKSIKRQFEAFKRGFEMVTDESPLRLLFRPEEIELLVCGSKKFDFVELEKSTEYDGGYTKDTQIIKDFWEIVHAMPEESKRKLLEFTTGSDRVPVGGLSRLKLLITRHSPDCDRLPTSHTCFNILLLPEYSSKEKLEERLLKAITYSKGFGML